jgi:hypothetical protein
VASPCQLLHSITGGTVTRRPSSVVFVFVELDSKISVRTPLWMDIPVISVGERYLVLAKAAAPHIKRRYHDVSVIQYYVTVVPCPDWMVGWHGTDGDEARL